jgi:hypothetical protein
MALQHEAATIRAHAAEQFSHAQATIEHSRQHIVEIEQSIEDSRNRLFQAEQSQEIWQARSN